MIDGAVYLALPLRTPIGREGGAARDLDAHELAAAVLRAQAAAIGDAVPVRRVVLANVCTGGNVARAAALDAELPDSTPALTVNSQCTGGLTAVRLAVEAALAGGDSLVLAGGAESVSRSIIDLGGDAPRRGGGGRSLPRIRHAPDRFGDPPMGPAADALAAKLGIDRAAQDEYAHESYERAVRARTAGFFDGVVVPVALAGGGVFERDETPRRIPPIDHLRRYPAAFGSAGTVTAGNAAAIGDGAAAVAVGPETAMAAAGAAPLARVLAVQAAAGDPSLPALAVIPAIEGALKAAGLAATEIDRWEINEAFAVKVVACIRHFGLDRGQVNVNGGAIAFGHPFAASGAILLVHLLEELRRSGARYGLAAIAGAGGLGEAMVVELLPGTATLPDDATRHER